MSGEGRLVQGLSSQLAGRELIGESACSSYPLKNLRNGQGSRNERVELSFCVTKVIHERTGRSAASSPTRR